jgi:CRISPR-associated protein Cas2
VSASPLGRIVEIAEDGRHIASAIPDKGRVHLLSVTDRQFEQMSVFRGKSRSRGRSVPNQLELF